MVGQRTAIKPSRSDEMLDAEEQLKITNQIKAHFDALAPKRPYKPNRSEADDVHANLEHIDQYIPEVERLRSLQASHVILRAEGAILVPDEFVETQYYSKLASIDKQHHTTGTGFIKVVQEGRDGDHGYNNIVMNQRSQDGSSYVRSLEAILLLMIGFPEMKMNRFRGDDLHAYPEVCELNYNLPGCFFFQAF